MCERLEPDERRHTRGRGYGGAILALGGGVEGITPDGGTWALTWLPALSVPAFTEY